MQCARHIGDCMIADWSKWYVVIFIGNSFHGVLKIMMNICTKYEATVIHIHTQHCIEETVIFVCYSFTIVDMRYK